MKLIINAFFQVAGTKRFVFNFAVICIFQKSCTMIACRLKCRHNPTIKFIVVDVVVVVTVRNGCNSFRHEPGWLFVSLFLLMRVYTVVNVREDPFRGMLFWQLYFFLSERRASSIEDLQLSQSALVYRKIVLYLSNSRGCFRFGITSNSDQPVVVRYVKGNQNSIVAFFETRCKIKFQEDWLMEI